MTAGWGEVVAELKGPPLPQTTLTLPTRKTTGAGFLNLGTVSIWGWSISCWGGCPVPYTVFPSIPSLYPPRASNPLPPQMGQPKMSAELPSVPWRAISTPLRTSG